MKEDKIIKKWVKQLPEEAPSNNFTNKIMDQIEPLGQKVYQPLISKKAWAIIVISFASLATLLAFQEGYHSNLYLPEFSYPEISLNSWVQLFNIGPFTSPVISMSIAAVLMLWTFLMLIQGMKIQQIFNKRFIF
jgi:hypothetical protein